MINTQKGMRPIYSPLDRTSLVNEGFIIWQKVTFSLRDENGKSRAGKVVGPISPARVANQNAGFTSPCRSRILENREL